MTQIRNQNVPQETFAWCMYDWANSVYSLVIATAIFPIYYYSLVGDTVELFGTTFPAESVRTYAISFSYLLVILLNPIIGGLADAKNLKKKLLMGFCYTGALACIGLFGFGDGNAVLYGLGCFVVATTAFAVSDGLYNAFLPDIATPDRFDRLSARGFSLGYIGSSLLLIFSLALVFQHEALGVTKDAVTRWVFVITGLWWAGFGSYTFYHLKQRPKERKANTVRRQMVLGGFTQLLQSIKALRNQRLAGLFLLIFLCYDIGVQTTLNVATDFGTKELRLEATNLILALLMIQFVAIVGAMTFGRLSEQVGDIFALRLAVTGWLILCILAYFVQNATQFYALGAGVGLLMGGTQSVSRAVYAKLLPKTEDANASFFSFYSVMDKIAVIIGTFLFGFASQLLGSMRPAILGLSFFFALGFILLTINRFPKQTD